VAGSKARRLRLNEVLPEFKQGSKQGPVLTLIHLNKYEVNLLLSSLISFYILSAGINGGRAALNKCYAESYLCEAVLDLEVVMCRKD